MTEADIDTALAAAIRAAVGSLTVYWQNLATPDVPPPPFVGVQIVRLARRTPALAGGKTIYRGRIVATFASELGKGAAGSNDTADGFAAAFPKARKITAGAVRITVREAPDVREGRAATAHWEQQVIVDYEAS